MRPALLAALLAAPLLAPPPAAAQEPLSVELNKLEDFEGGCRSFFLFRNRGAADFNAFEMALAILDPGGVIDRLLTIDAAPLPAGRTTLKIFEIPETACAEVGEIILHDMPACDAAPGGDCFAAVALSSRAAAPLVK